MKRNNRINQYRIEYDNDPEAFIRETERIQAANKKALSELEISLALGAASHAKQRVVAGAIVQELQDFLNRHKS